jgi:hypothetical protein
LLVGAFLALLGGSAYQELLHVLAGLCDPQALLHEPAGHFSFQASLGALVGRLVFLALLLGPAESGACLEWMRAPFGC